jgi:hypothetical protein
MLGGCGALGLVPHKRVKLGQHVEVGALCAEGSVLAVSDCWTATKVYDFMTGEVIDLVLDYQDDGNVSCLLWTKVSESWVLLIGHERGRLLAFDAFGNELMSQIFHNSSLLKIKRCASVGFLVPKPEGIILVQEPNVVVFIDGQSLKDILMDPGSSRSLKLWKWRLEIERIKDLEGFESFTSKFGDGVKFSSVVTLLACGSNPMILKALTDDVIRAKFSSSQAF